jgi:hypothetical protein
VLLPSRAHPRPPRSGATALPRRAAQLTHASLRHLDPPRCDPLLAAAPAVRVTNASHTVTRPAVRSAHQLHAPGPAEHSPLHAPASAHSAALSRTCPRLHADFHGQSSLAPRTAVRSCAPGACARPAWPTSSRRPARRVQPRAWAQPSRPRALSSCGRRSGRARLPRAPLPRPGAAHTALPWARQLPPPASCSRLLPAARLEPLGAAQQSRVEEEINEREKTVGIG